MIRGRRITPTDVQIVQALLSEKPELGRWRLALELCQRWQWRTAHGDWKSRAAGAVLSGMAERGWIQLPASRRSASPGPARSPAVEGWAVPAIGGPLSRHRPLRWELVRTAQQRQQWRQLLDAYHYLRAPGMVGANLKYFVYSRAGPLLAALGWQSAVAHLGCRNRFLAWSPAQQVRYLDRLVNNVRFLLLPWVEVPCLASVLLSEGVQRLRRDWPEHYGAPVWWVESFVDRERFEGGSYRAADWVAIGWTRGFAKRREGFVHHGRNKEVYVYVTEPRMLRLIHGEDRQPLVNRARLLAQRESEEQRLAKARRMKRILGSWKAALPSSGELRVAEREKVGQELSAFAALFHPAFRRVEPRQWLELHLQSFLSQAQGTNPQLIGGRLDDPDQVRNFERFLSDYRWDEGWMAGRHWQLAAETLSDPQGIWTIDTWQFPKEATAASVGVARQYCRALGKAAPCQSGVFIGYSSPRGHALLDSRLHLPPGWFEPEFQGRRQQCRIPKETAFQTQAQLALELLGPLWKSQQFGGPWITCEGSLANQEGFLEQLPKDGYYLAEIADARQVWIKSTDFGQGFRNQSCTVGQLLTLGPWLHWQTDALSENSPMMAAWARVRVYWSAPWTPQSEGWILLRQDPNQQVQFALSNAPEETTLHQLVEVGRARWSRARAFQQDPSLRGLHRYAHRSWPAWHRHMRLVFLTQLFLLRRQIQSPQSSGAELVASAPTIPFAHEPP